jgi:hypothetical protein
MALKLSLRLVASAVACCGWGSPDEWLLDTWKHFETISSRVCINRTNAALIDASVCDTSE